MAVTQANRERLWNDKFRKIKSYYLTEDGAAPAIAETIAPDSHFELIGIRVKSDGAVTTSENLTVTVDTEVGAGFDSVALTVDLSTIATIETTGYEHLFDPLRTYSTNDEIDIAFANTEANQITIELIVRLAY
jgi:hypothetical protein